LLFLDKQLSDIRDLVGKMTELDPAIDWNTDPNTGLYRSGEVKSHTTQKVEEFIVVVPATEQHPAQVSKAVKDVVVGEWTTVRFSGAVPATRKREMLNRVQQLLDAVKFALEEANMTTVDNIAAGNAVLSYIFA
jgi:Asp-tRNA(Asn)/Glu-tRNA(Gln) amidotransferase C subunit